MYVILVYDCGERRSEVCRNSLTSRVLIGPCGIETLYVLICVGVCDEVLIGPCGIETLEGSRMTRFQYVLIGPCGIETLGGRRHV